MTWIESDSRLARLERWGRSAKGGRVMVLLLTGLLISHIAFAVRNVDPRVNLWCTGSLAASFAGSGLLTLHLFAAASRLRVSRVGVPSQPTKTIVALLALSCAAYATSSLSALVAFVIGPPFPNFANPVFLVLMGTVMAMFSGFVARAYAGMPANKALQLPSASSMSKDRR